MKRQLAVSLIKKYFPNGEIPAAVDLSCIADRQLGGPLDNGGSLDNVIAVDRVRCRHGFVRAMVRYPVGENCEKMSSNMIRLTCPHLVKEIDALEASGGITAMNSALAWRDDLKDNYKNTNEVWSAVRNDATNEKESDYVEEVLGPEGKKHFFESGIIGVTKGKTDDAKCLHAHVGDLIMRGGNLIGQLAIKELEKKDINTTGCAGKLNRETDMTCDRYAVSRLVLYIIS
jgi:hypothetical protein